MVHVLHVPDFQRALPSELAHFVPVYKNEILGKFERVAEAEGAEAPISISYRFTVMASPDWTPSVAHRRPKREVLGF